MSDFHILYNELANWWPLMSSPADYAEEAAFYGRTIAAACVVRPRSMLELGSGGGNNASHLKKLYNLTLVDLSSGMIEVSRRLNPECEHHRGDMRHVRLDRQFDCVFIHDAIGYMTTKHELRLAIETAFVHCKPGGAALFAPDHTRETFQPTTTHGGHDGDDRALRYLEWTWDPDPSDDTCTADYAFLLRETTGATLRVLHERHVEGLFAQADWHSLMRDVGFEPEMLPFEHSEVSDREMYVFVGKKAAP